MIARAPTSSEVQILRKRRKLLVNQPSPNPAETIQSNMGPVSFRDLGKDHALYVARQMIAAANAKIESKVVEDEPTLSLKGFGAWLDFNPAVKYIILECVSPRVWLQDEKL